MSQIFHPSANSLSRFSIYGALFVLAALGWMVLVLNRSSYVTGETVIKEQPVPFSHDHHTAALGIDCRYCHTSVESSSFAGIPPTSTCMNCHKEIWKDSPMLEPVRESWRSNRPIEWVRIHDLPDFTYFNHSIHLAKGVACVSCHGRVDRMPLIWQAASLQMEWCLDCHRQPERYVRPREELFTMDWVAPADDPGLGTRLIDEYGIQGPRRLTSCSTCHR